MSELGSEKGNPRCESQSIDGYMSSAGDCILNVHTGTEDQVQGEDRKEHLNNPSISQKKREISCHINLQKNQADSTP